LGTGGKNWGKHTCKSMAFLGKKIVVSAKSWQAKKEIPPIKRKRGFEQKKSGKGSLVKRKKKMDRQTGKKNTK